jgi:ketosteroid isomerase-like protein
MDELNAKVREFFDGYESANAEFEVQKIAAFYADLFMFGDPQGVRCVKKEDFVRVFPRRKEFFQSVGLVSSKIESLEASGLDSKYALAKAVWKMRFERGTGQPVDSQNSATYILSAAGDSFQIVFQIDHQDLTKRVQDLGLK